MADEQLDEKNLNSEEAGAATADARVLELEEQLAAAKDQSLRAAADLQNIRRRAEQDVEKAHKFALEKFSSDLLPVIDSLELALAHSSAEDENVKKIREGVELTLKMFQDTLKRYNLEAVDPHGQPFNAEHHQAMAMQERRCRAEQRDQCVPEGLPAQWPPAAPCHGGGQQGAERCAAFDQ